MVYESSVSREFENFTGLPTFSIIMVQCFEAECNHCSDRETCTFYKFPKDLNMMDGK